MPDIAPDSDWVKHEATNPDAPLKSQGLDPNKRGISEMDMNKKEDASNGHPQRHSVV